MIRVHTDGRVEIATPEEFAEADMLLGVPDQRPDVARIVYGDAYADVHIPADGATLGWVLEAAVAYLPAHVHGPVCLVDDEANAVLLFAGSAIEAGKTYRLCEYAR